jgi:hypothetical protein
MMMRNNRVRTVHTKVGELIADAGQEQRGLLEQPPRTLHGLARVARAAARLEGEMVVLYEVELALRHFAAANTDAPEDVLLHAAMYGARRGPSSSNLDAEAFAEGQRNALTKIALLIPVAASGSPEVARVGER